MVSAAAGATLGPIRDARMGVWQVTPRRRTVVSDPASKPEANYNAAVVKTCRANKIPIAYIFEDLQKQPDRKKLLAGDGVHFMSGGWAVVGPAWNDALRQVNFVLLDRP